MNLLTSDTCTKTTSRRSSNWKLWRGFWRPIKAWGLKNRGEMTGKRTMLWKFPTFTDQTYQALGRRLEFHALPPPAIWQSRRCAGGNEILSRNGTFFHSYSDNSTSTEHRPEAARGVESEKHQWCRILQSGGEWAWFYICSEYIPPPQDEEGPHVFNTRRMVVTYLRW